MTLSYARQQQLDNAVKAFYKGFGNTDTEEEDVDYILKTEACKELVQWLEEDTSMSNETGSEPRNPAKNILKYEMSYMTPLHTNVAGGKQSHVARDYTLIPQEALASLARVMYNGALKYNKDNWKLIHKRDHLNHALNHINLYLAGNTSEDHLAHATARLMMALELDLTEENDDA